MMLLGIAGGALYGLIPALLKVRFGVNEILTSLMLVYVAQLMPRLSRARAVARPEGLQLPAIGHLRPLRHPAAALRRRAACIPASLFALVAVLVDGRSSSAARCSAIACASPARRRAPRASRGFDANRTTLAVFAISGGLAGLAGICEVAGQIGQLQPSISPGYGFTAITVAFLGRLNPFGILVAALVVALTFIGGESAQILLKLPLDLTQAFQGILLLCVLAADALVSYRVRVVGRGGPA